MVWGNKPAKLAELASQLPNLKLVQSAMTGAEIVLAAIVAPEATICSGAGLRNDPVVEHTDAKVLIWGFGSIGADLARLLRALG